GPSSPGSSCSRLSPRLDRAAHQHQAAGRAGHSTLDQQQALVVVNAVQGEVQHRGALPAHPAGHLHALEHVPRESTAANRSRRAVLALSAVRGAKALEAVPFHDAGEALALALGRYVDDLAGLELLGGDLVADRVLLGVTGPKLHEVAPRGNPG